MYLVAYLSLPIDSVVHCIRYANIKNFLSHISLYMDRVQTYTEIHMRENPYICIYYPMWHISLINPKKYTLLNKNGHSTVNAQAKPNVRWCKRLPHNVDSECHRDNLITLHMNYGHQNNILMIFLMNTFLNKLIFMQYK